MIIGARELTDLTSDNYGPSKLRGMKLADLTSTDQNAWVEIDRPGFDGLSNRGGH